MNTVWIVMRGEQYEGGEIKGVFDTQLKAIACAYELMQNDRELWSLGTVEDCVTNAWENVVGWITISQHEVV